MTRLAFALLLVALTTPAAAQDLPSLPSFNSEQSCKHLVNEQCRATIQCNHYDVAAYTSSCALEEAIAIGKIRGKWQDLAPSIRSYCLRWLGSVENYKVLNECLDREFALRPAADGERRFYLQRGPGARQAFPNFSACITAREELGAGVCVGR
jgi:hypothetical protein